MRYHPMINDTKSVTVSSAKNHTETHEGIIVPPGCDHAALHHCGEKVTTYTPASYRPFSASSLPAPSPPHAMQGKSAGLSVPKAATPSAEKSMTDYLRQFCGAHLCLDLWMNNRCKIKKCGILTEIGRDFLVLREPTSDKLHIIDLKPIRYITLYCR